MLFCFYFCLIVTFLFFFRVRCFCCFFFSCALVSVFIHVTGWFTLVLYTQHIMWNVDSFAMREGDTRQAVGWIWAIFFPTHFFLSIFRIFCYFSRSLNIERTKKAKKQQMVGTKRVINYRVGVAKEIDVDLLMVFVDIKFWAFVFISFNRELSLQSLLFSHIFWRKKRRDFDVLFISSVMEPTTKPTNTFSTFDWCYL